jgi:predicted permease
MPDWKRHVRERLPEISWDGGRDAEIIEELAQDLEQRYQYAVGRGSEAAAVVEVLSELDDAAGLAGEIRSAVRAHSFSNPEFRDLPGKRGTMFSDLRQDLRYSGRMIMRNPLFSAVAVLSLALAIGANTAIFTVVNTLLLNPLPAKDPGRLAAVFTTDETNTGRFFDFMQVSFPNYADYRDQNQVFNGLAASVFAPVSLQEVGAPEQILAELVSGNYFDVLGVEASLGRTFAPDEDSVPGAHPVVVLNHGLWKRKFGSRDDILGKTITLNRHPFTVIGVAPESFRGVNALAGPGMWVPTAMRNELLTGIVKEWFLERRALLFNLFGRLRPGISLEQADAAMKTLAKQLERAHPNENHKRSVALVPLTQATINPGQRGDFVRAGWVLAGVVGLVLLIACANVANLLLERSAARQREIAVRVSLGASRWRLVRQLLTESLLLALIAGGFGLLLGMWSRDLLWRMRPPFLNEDALALTLDTSVLAFTLAVSLATGLMFGLVPALQGSRPDLATALNDRSAQTGRGNRILSLRNLLVMGQVAFSMIALIGAGLFLRSMSNAHRIDPGFDSRRLGMISFDLGAQGYDEARGQEFARSVVERVSALPMIEAAAVASSPPFGGGFSRTVFPEGQDHTDRRNGRLTPLIQVTPAYFESIGMSIVRGRGFTGADRAGTPMVAVINQTMARRMWPDEEAIGRRFRCFGEDWIIEVVGIAPDAKYFTLGEEPQPFFYLPFLQHYAPNVTLYVRAYGDPAGVLGNVRTMVQEMDRSMPLTNVNTSREVVDQVLWAPRMAAQLLASFGGLALVLASIGIHGVISYSVRRRTHEIGIRIALGAQVGDVVRMVLWQAGLIVAAGVAGGIGIALVAGRGLGSLLYGVRSADPVTFASTAALLMAITLLASYIPARRATRIDPLEALRTQ